MWVRNPSAITEITPDGDHLVVFDRSTGETHFLNDLSAIILKHLDRDPCSLEEILDRLKRWSRPELDTGAASKVKLALKALEDAELVNYQPADQTECER